MCTRARVFLYALQADDQNTEAILSGSQHFGGLFGGRGRGFGWVSGGSSAVALRRMISANKSMLETAIIHLKRLDSAAPNVESDYLAFHRTVLPANRVSLEIIRFLA